jgi:hypothetical protein
VRDAVSTCADVGASTEELLSVWPVKKRHALDFGSDRAFKSNGRIWQPSARFRLFRSWASAASLRSQRTVKSLHPEPHSMATNPEPGCSPGKR